LSGKFPSDKTEADCPSAAHSAFNQFCPSLVPDAHNICCTFGKREGEGNLPMVCVSSDSVLTKDPRIKHLSSEHCSKVYADCLLEEMVSPELLTPSKGAGRGR